MFFRLLGLALVAGGLAAAPEQGSRTLREETFVLELPPQDRDPRLRPAPPDEVGVAVLRRSEVDGSVQCEWDVRFYGDDTRVLHVESTGSGTERLVWREWRPGAGRSLTAEGTPAGFEVVEWGRHESLRTRLEAPEGGSFPIAALERAREGELATGRFAWFDPLARAVERGTVTLAFGAEPTPDSRGEAVLERRFELVRDDGTRAVRWVFRGDELWEVEWAAGGLVGRRVARPGYEERVGRCAAPGSVDPLER